jgi:radical SAM superfamily enzyme YgiQ (UPF0313 family)
VELSNEHKDGDAPMSGKKKSAPPVVVGLAQINNSFSGQSYLPYSVAMLQAFAQVNAAHKERYVFLQPIYKRARISDIVEKLLDAHVVGLSAYAWNIRISLEVARRLKERKPDILMVFGGPHVPDQPEAFLREHDFIDIAVHNEGESVFLEILEVFPGNDWGDLMSISYIDGNDVFHRNTQGERFRDLDDLPSPFLEGIFNSLMADHPDERWIGLWETNRGCPFKCTFCDWGSAIAARVNKFGIERLKKEADWFADNKIEYIFCCDANFGIQKRDVEIASYVAEVKARAGYPLSLSVQNTKNATERAYQTQKILADSGLGRGVMLSMQSVDPGTLESIKRDNISTESYMDLQYRFARDGIETYNDLILGLPGETYHSFCEGTNMLIESGQHSRIQFNILTVLPNAEMGDPDYQAKYGMELVESEIVTFHALKMESDDDVPETQELVIATRTMPREDWCRTCAFSWMTTLLHFNKLMQIPFIMVHAMTGLLYREMIEAFLEADAATYPIISGISDFFFSEARSIQNGGPEFVYSPDWLGIYWNADEYVFIELTAELKFEAFYDEARALLKDVIGERGDTQLWDVIDDAISLNHALLKKPDVVDNITVKTNYDVMSFYEGFLCGDEAPLRHEPTVMEIDRSSETWDLQEWCRQVVWYGMKKGAYFYGRQSHEMQLAGHY